MKVQSCLLLVLALSCKPVHGNGKVEGAEQCDDGNSLSGDGCNISCELETCGDGLINNGNLEQCDDGNQDNDDGCSSVCRRERCGDGIVNNTKEQCDDDNVDNNDGCNSRCQLEFCGDGIVNNKTEECDDGNLDSGDTCESNCQKPKYLLEFFPAKSIPLSDSYSDWITTKDLDHDGNLDFVRLSSGTPSVRFGGGEDDIFGSRYLPEVSPESSDKSSSVVALGDFNGDGQYDLISHEKAFSGGTKVLQYLGNDSFFFDSPSMLASSVKLYSIAVGDINKDGKDDAILSSKDEVRLWLGTTSGLTKDVKIGESSVSDVAISDFNGDSFLDVAELSNHSVIYFFGDKSGALHKDKTIEVGPANRFTAGDVNNDGVTDLIIAGDRLQTLIYQKEGPLLTGWLPLAIRNFWMANSFEVCDFNNDGNLDAAVLEEKYLQVFLGSGAGELRQVYMEELPPHVDGLATGDINKDGACDLITYGDELSVRLSKTNERCAP